MTDLERFAAALLSQWRAEGEIHGGPIVIGALIDRTFSYRVARRLLGIDVSEDYEALVMRLIAGEEGLVDVLPEEAGEMARATMAERLPDLDVLKLLRYASITVTPDAVMRLDGMPFGEARAEADAKWKPIADDRAPAPNQGSNDELPTSEPTVVIPLPTARDATTVVPRGDPAEPPPPYLTGPAEFTPPEASCWKCSELLPANRTAKFCPHCGADQRAPTCGSCGASVERTWRHCPDCGSELGAS